MNPRPASRATSNMAPVRIATIAASSTYSAEPTAASGVSPAARIAAVVESAPTTRCRDEQRITNTVAGMIMV